MVYFDFAVRYDPSKDTLQDVARRILYTIFIKRIKGKKPAIVFIGADSSEGKSYAALILELELLKMQGIDLLPYVNLINVYTPLEYPQKLKELLFNKEYKKVNIIAIHDAREVVRAKLWHSFLNQCVSDINVLSRAVKRMVTIIISQFIRDIDMNTRYTLTYYCTVRRPIGYHSRLYFNVMWKDDSDLEKPKLRKRRLVGYLVYPDGKWRRYPLGYIELSLPPKEIREIFDKNDIQSKAKIIHKKMNQLMKVMENEVGVESKKVDTMVDWYIERPDSLSKLGRFVRGKWKLFPNVREIHEMTDEEANEFSTKIEERLKKIQSPIENEINQELNLGGNENA